MYFISYFFIILPTINYITSNKLNYIEYIQYCSMNVKLFTLQILYFMTHNKSIHEINEWKWLYNISIFLFY